MKCDRSYLQELIGSYKGCCEPWKIKLTAIAIVEMGVPLRHWDDLMQDLMIRVVRFRHRPIEGVQEKTALNNRVRSRIIDFMRKEKRQDARLQKLFSAKHEETYTIDILQLCGEDPKSTLCRAVRAAVAQLGDYQQQICRLFMQGHNKAAVAKKAGVSWRELAREIASIRSRFVAMGIEEIISWRTEQRQGARGCG